MIIRHDKFYVSTDRRIWIDAGFAKEIVHTLHFSYCPTDADRYLEQLACRNTNLDGQQQEARLGIKKGQSNAMREIMDNIASHFVVLQCDEGEPVLFNSSFWELFFWCSYRREQPYYGRDYSHFMLSFNGRQTPEQQMLVYKRVLDFLEQNYHDHPNLNVTVLYNVWFDEGRIKAEAKKMGAAMDGWACRFHNMCGRLVLDGGRPWFRPDGTQTRLHFVSNTELLQILWELEPTEEELHRQT